MLNDDLGGDAACWAHLFSADHDSAIPARAQPVVRDLGAADTNGHSGAIWHLPHGGDLDANLVRLQAGHGIAGHVNDEVDVIVFVQSGRGEIEIDGSGHELRPDVLVLIPKGAHRSVRAGSDGITYLSIHRRREPMGVVRSDKSGVHHER